jgi:apolipoprotein N-acyltransferase
VAWVALVPLLVVLARRAVATPAAPIAPARAFVLGLATGAAYFTGTLYWLTDVMVTFGGLPRVAAVPVAGLLVAYLSIYPGVFAWSLARAINAIGLRALWLAPVVWVATEFLRGWLFTGFPWVALGYSQARVLPIAQLASVGGVSLLSALVVLVSSAVAVAALARARGHAVRALGVAAAVVLVVAAWGQWRLQRGELTAAGEPLRVGVVQGNVPQHEKWDPAHAGRILDRYLDLTRQVASEGATLVVWPESATPFFFEYEPAGRQAILDVARETGAWLLLGSDQVEPGRPGQPHRYYNAAFLVSPAGREAGVYRKVHLVPFGEYVPLRALLFFAQPLVEGVGDFAAGTEVTPLDVAGRRVTTAICYESVFPYLARQAVTGGSRLLTAITNDAWYGWSSAPVQHFEQGALRAVETGRYFVRAANTGISAIVDPYGRVLARRGLFETATIAGEVRLLEGRTVYATIGDSPAWACVAITVVVLVVTRRRPSSRTRRGRP